MNTVKYFKYNTFLKSQKPYFNIKKTPKKMMQLYFTSDTLRNSLFLFEQKLLY